MNTLSRPFHFLMFLFLLAGTATAETVREERFLLRHQSPETVLNRLELLHGTADLNAKGVLFSAEGGRTLLMRIPAGYGDEVERGHLHLTVDRLLHLLDQPEPKVDLSVFIVQASLLTEEEFARLDRQLRSAPLELPMGTLAKGVVVHHRAEVPNLEVHEFSRQIEEARGTTQRNPVEIRGRIVPSIVPREGHGRIITDMTVRGLDTPITEAGEPVRLAGSAALRSEAPQIILVGEERQLPRQEGTGPRPLRHELTAYVWMRAVDEPSSR